MPNFFFTSNFFCRSFSIALCILCSSMHLSGVQIRYNILAYLIRVLNICLCMTYVGSNVRENQSSCLFESKPWEMQSADHSSCSQCTVWYAANPVSKALSSSLWNLLHLFHKVTLNLFNLFHHCF